MGKYILRESEIPWREVMPGFFVKTFTYIEDRFAIGMMRAKSGFAHPLETHEMEEYAYVMKGRAETQIGDEKAMIGPGDYFVIPANTPHSVRVFEDTELIGFLSPPRPELR